MAHVISARLPDETVARVKQYALRKRRTVNDTLATAVEEWLRQNEFAFIEFRDSPDGREAYMKNSRLAVYQVIKIARSLDMEMERLRAYWPDRPRDWIEAALTYYGAYPREIDERITLSEADTFGALKRRFPRLERFELPAETPDEDPR